MKLTLFLAISLVLNVWRFQIADCRVASPIKNFSHSKNVYPSGFNLSSEPENSPLEIKPCPPVGPKPVQINSTKVTDDELRQLTETLFSRENSQLNQISVNLQGRTSSNDTNDVAPEPLLRVSDKVFNVTTISKLRALFDNYHMDTSVNENFTAAELQEQDDFLDTVMATNIMKITIGFLQSKGVVSSNPRSQKEFLKTIWFKLYDRGQGALGSSGFEHVFLNEIDKGRIIGLHNWVYFSQREKAGHVDYKGYVNELDLETKARIVEARFTYNDLSKPVSTLFVGTTPELEMALYTICFQFRPDELCRLSLGGKNFSIQADRWWQCGQALIGTTYPNIQNLKLY